MIGGEGRGGGFRGRESSGKVLINRNRNRDS